MSFPSMRKMLRHGVRALDDSELLQLVSGAPISSANGSPEQAAPAVWAAKSLADWRRQQGIGRARAVRLVASFELGRRAWSSSVRRRPRVSRPADAYPHLRHLESSRKEQLVGLYLDTQHGLLRQEVLSVGSLNITRTHPREILYPAIRHLAAGFILAHNHPSGCPDPSPEDWAFTRAVRDASALMGIELHDHLIVATDGFVSLRELPEWDADGMR